MDELLYKICLAISKGENPTYEDLGIDKETYGTAIEDAKEDGYITNVLVVRNGQGNKVYDCGLTDGRLTSKGRRFLEINKK